MLSKLGVYGLDNIHPTMRVVLKYVTECWGNEEPVVTSYREGSHSSGSYHYIGKALDFRLPKNALNKANELKELLGEDYDVVVEDTHIHIEHDIKN